jgi:hypothetical protein
MVGAGIEALSEETIWIADGYGPGDRGGLRGEENGLLNGGVGRSRYAAAARRHPQLVKSERHFGCRIQAEDLRAAESKAVRLLYSVPGTQERFGQQGIVLRLTRLTALLSCESYSKKRNKPLIYE